MNATTNSLTERLLQAFPSGSFCLPAMLELASIQETDAVPTAAVECCARLNGRRDGEGDPADDEQPSGVRAAGADVGGGSGDRDDGEPRGFDACSDRDHRGTMSPFAPARKPSAVRGAQT